MAFRTNKTPVLQTKTASGSVASFNTALAMPLTSCNIAVNAWQEGSGDPSPSNVRNIVGFNALNMTKTGKNLCDLSFLEFNDSIYQHIKVGNVIKPFLYVLNCLKGVSIKITMITTGTTTSTVPIGQIRIFKGSTNLFQINGNTAKVVPNVDFSDADAIYIYGTINTTTMASATELMLLIAEESNTDYEPYQGNTYTIQLGQEVYGAELDVVNGVMTVTHKFTDMGSLSWNFSSSASGYFYANISDILPNSTLDSMCEEYNPTVVGNLPSLPNYSYVIDVSQYRIYCKNYDYTDATDFTNAVDGVILVYKLRSPFTVQLTPTQIETLIGNNTIFADTGDVDLTYKDLDIAKRGSFREVFKLPS